MTTPATARELAKLLDKMGDLHAQMALINLADQVDALTKERDALLLANKDLSNWFDALKTDYDALMAAGKLALEALLQSTEAFVPQREAAITALKKAGAAA